MKLWFVPFGSRKLVSPYKVYGGNNRIVDAQPFTMQLRRVMVGPRLDGWPRGDNDVLITTVSNLGSAPPIERVHFYKEELKAQTPLGPFLGRQIYVHDDYKGKTLWLNFKILEVDIDLGDRDEVIEALTGFANSMGAVFPAILPYTAVSSVIIKAANKIISAFEKNQPVIDCPMTFYGPKRFGMPLQKGVYVVFSDAVDGSKFELQDDLLLKWSQDWSGKLSYAVFTVEDVSEVSSDFIDYIVTQRVATLIKQIEKGNPNPVKSSFEFLKETLEGYSIAKDLKRYLELKKKDSKSEPEDELFKRLTDKLKPFLPS